MTNLKTKIENIFPKTIDDVPQEYRVNPIEQCYYLGKGITHHAKYGRYQKVFSPIHIGDSPVYLGKYPMMTKKTALEILDITKAAWDNGNGEWAMLSHKERIVCIRNFVELMKTKRSVIVNMLMWEICKTKTDAESEFDRTITYTIDTCDALEALLVPWSTPRQYKDLSITVGRNPHGICLCMGPSNYPLNETFTTLIPALITGNVVIFKPAKIGVLLLEPILECFTKALPKGVVTTLYGDGAKIISPIMRSKELHAFAFIGGTSTADRIIAKCINPHQMETILGMGAKNPYIVLEGADIQAAVQLAVKSALGYNGHRCTAAKIIFVHSSILQEFLAELVRQIEKLVPGMPWEKGVNITPMLPGSMEWMLKLLNDATLLGAEILNEEGGTTNQGFMHPAVLYPVTKSMLLFREEQFGPLVPVNAFDDISEVLDWIKASKYGQQISVFGNKTKDGKTVDHIIHMTKNQRCRININCQCQRGPDDISFSGRGGSAKRSLSLIEALLEFTVPDVVSIHESYC